MDLAEAKILVTGGSSGIGRATAALLIERGAQVAICGRTEDTLHEAAEETGAVSIQADVSDEADVERLVSTVKDELGGYDTLINNAGIGAFGELVDLDGADFRRVWETNVWGAMLVARASAQHFIAQENGNIINISSTAGKRGFAGGTAYVASKFALGGMTECWRAELRPHNVRVMQVNPSEVITDFSQNAGLGEQKDNPTKLHAEDIAQVIADLLALDSRGFVPETSVWATNPR